MAHNFCYYKTLGVDRTADSEVITKAYRQLAKKYHPDRNVGDEEAKVKYQEVDEAYSTLSDPIKRSHYDLRTGFQNQTQTINLNDICDAFFNPRPRQQNWGQHVETEIVIDFLESAKGCTKNLQIDRRESCKSCKATGAKDGKEFKQCVLCDGKGRETHINANLRFETKCKSCNGTGKVIAEFCTNCAARGFNLSSSSLDIRIPAGINNGMKICVRGEGDIGLNGTGNLYCVVRVIPHPLFQREGINLSLKLPVGYAQAVLGGEIDVPCLEGSCKFKIPPGTRSGSTFRLNGLGFKLPDDDETARGDMLIKIMVDAPFVDDISEDYKEVLKKLSILEKEHPGNLCKSYDKTLEFLRTKNE